MHEEEYVSEILHNIQVGLTKAGFYARCESDVNAGYRAAVDEAWSRYQSQGLSAGRKSKTLAAREVAK